VEENAELLLPQQLGEAAVAAMFPAVSEASEVVSTLAVSPAEAMSCPALSMRKAARLFESSQSRSSTAASRRASSSYSVRSVPIIRGSPRVT